MYKWLDKMIVGMMYEFTESDGEKILGTYQGLANDPEWIDYIIVWEGGRASGTLMNLADIIGVKEVIIQ